MTPPYTPTRSLALPTTLVRETVIAGAAYGTIIDHTGIHNALRVGHGPRAAQALEDWLESRDAACELPDGTLHLAGGRAWTRPEPEPEPDPPPVPRRRRQAIVRPPHFWTEPKIAAAFQRWVVEYGAPPRSWDWDPGTLRRKGMPQLAERFEAGVWPHRCAVEAAYGSWRSGMREALGVEVPVGRPKRVASC